MRTIIDIFDRHFADLTDRADDLVRKAGDRRLYLARDINDRQQRTTVGELILRSSGRIEQMAGGITRRLWDDPFEWTLPEQLRRVEDVAAYIHEVEESRNSAFEFLQTDEDLKKRLPAPVAIKTLFDVLLETLVAAERYYAKAESVLRDIDRGPE